MMSQYSQVFSWRRGTVLRPWKNGWYDTYVTLRRDGKSYSRKVKTLYESVFVDMLELQVN